MTTLKHPRVDITPGLGRVHIEPRILFRQRGWTMAVVSALRQIARAMVPVPARWWIRTHVLGKELPPPAGVGKYLSLRRLRPIRRDFGFEYGQCVDRYFIETFLQEHATDINGHVLEVGDATYTRRFGQGRVARSDVVHLTSGNPHATIVADLTDGSNLPSDGFDCIIFTQTLQFIYDVSGVVGTLHRILKPGGVVLATVPGISQISRYDMREWGDFWRFTSASAARLFEGVFGRDHVRVHAYGNVMAATAFLHGLVSSELTQQELDFNDPDYEVTITIRASKPVVTTPASRHTQA